MLARIVSIGYERRSVDELVNILLNNRVEILIDVRELPLSRRKGFSKTALSARLDEVGIEYRHMRIAGNPHRKLKANTELCLSLYSAYLSDNPMVIETMAAEISGGSVALLCYEREQCRCHRSVLLDALREHGHRIDVVEPP